MNHTLRTTAAVLAAALLALTACAAPSQARTRPSPVKVVSAVKVAPRPAPVPQVYAHRGGRLEAPEASMVAFRAAAARGAGLEMDVQALPDGTLVVMHDATVDRTTTGTGRVTRYTASAWSRLRIPAGGAPPTWGQVADAFPRTPMLVETKTAAAVQPLVDDIVRRGMQRAVIVESFVPEHLAAAEAAGLRTMLLLATSATPSVPAGTSWLGCAYLNRATCLGHGLPVATWGVNTVAVAQAAHRDGVAMVITDRPTRLARR